MDAPVERSLEDILGELSSSEGFLKYLEAIVRERLGKYLFDTAVTQVAQDALGECILNILEYQRDGKISGETLLGSHGSHGSNISLTVAVEKYIAVSVRNHCQERSKNWSGSIRILTDDQEDKRKAKDDAETVKDDVETIEDDPEAINAEDDGRGDIEIEDDLDKLQAQDVHEMEILSEHHEKKGSKKVVKRRGPRARYNIPVDDASEQRFWDSIAFDQGNTQRLAQDELDQLINSGRISEAEKSYLADKASGLSYLEIAARDGGTPDKYRKIVTRAIAKLRRANISR